jgi:4-diphosphocytidyl-2-C-methyl-D-erythritol kinase
MQANDSTAPWPAPAKLNLFLHVTGRRDDGYHTLQTVFQFIDLCDYLRFEPRDDGVIRRVGSIPGIDPEGDLIVRAARLLRHYAGVAQGVDMWLEKNIPIGGGLGGGSSDAATTLWALNRLWRLNYPVDVLAELGLSLGADVPVFVRGRTAWAEGVGERLTPLDLETPWYLIVVPPVQVQTGAIFRSLELTHPLRAFTIAGFLSGDQGVNDCEPIVRARHPEVARALDWLGRYAPARMSGTGGCVFASFDDRERAAEVLDRVPSEWRGFISRGRNRSPLMDRLDVN